MRTFGRLVSIIVILAILAAVLYMCARPGADGDLAPEGEVTVIYEECADGSQVPIDEECPLPDPVRQCWDGSQVPESQPCPPEPLPEPDLAQAQCNYPGDGFTPTPHGFSPTAGQYVEYQDARREGGFRPSSQTLPMPPSYDGTGDSACVVVTYDISETGRPMNLSVYDSSVASDANPALFEATARETVAEMRFTPAERNDKAIRLDNNVDVIRFEARDAF